MLEFSQQRHFNFTANNAWSVAMRPQLNKHQTRDRLPSVLTEISAHFTLCLNMFKSSIRFTERQYTRTPLLVQCWRPLRNPLNHSPITLTTLIKNYGEWTGTLINRASAGWDGAYAITLKTWNLLTSFTISPRPIRARHLAPADRRRHDARDTCHGTAGNGYLVKTMSQRGHGILTKYKGGFFF